MSWLSRIVHAVEGKPEAADAPQHGASNFFDKIGQNAGNAGIRYAPMIPALIAGGMSGGFSGEAGASGAGQSYGNLGSQLLHMYGGGGGGGGGDSSGGGGGMDFGGLGDIFGGLAGIGLGGQQLSKAGQGFQPSGMGMADNLWQQIIPMMLARNNQVPGQIDPQIQQSYMKMLGIDPSGLATAGATAGQQFGDLATQAQQYGGALGQAGMADIGHGQDIWMRALDPHQDQYNQQKNQALEGVRGAESARGIAMGGQGAGLESDAMRNFNIDWSKYQDQRMLDANSAALGANAGAGQSFGQAMNIGGQAPGYTMAGAQAPISGQTAAAQFPANAATTFAGQMYGTDPYGMGLDQINKYLGETLGIFGATPQFRANQTQAGYGNIANAIPGIFNGLGNIFGGGGGGGGGGFDPGFSDPGWGSGGF